MTLADSQATRYTESVSLTGAWEENDKNCCGILRFQYHETGSWVTVRKEIFSNCLGVLVISYFGVPDELRSLRGTSKKKYIM